MMHGLLLAVVVVVVQAGVGYARQFTYYDYNGILSALNSLESANSGFVKVDTAQGRFGLASPGKCGKSNCVQPIVTVTNFNTLAKDPNRPEVFFSGELHGDERIGPSATIEFIKLLMQYYDTNEWVKYLVDHRTIVIMPMANSKGYYEVRRTENGFDVNRDFPIDDPSSCMNTIAARALNELFKEHMFQLAITFHGGTEMIAYTWGTISALPKSKRKSPDETSQGMVTSSMSAYAGSFSGTRPYPHGRMNDIIYPVRGGMEDWAYASSWDSGHKHDPCQQSGYAASETSYTNDQLRAINILVETSNSKIPSEATLGSDQGIFNPQSSGNGHIPRNVRLMLLLTDVVQPYVKVVETDYDTNTFSWEVGGSLYVDKTYLEYTYTVGGKRYTKTSRALKGKTRWSGGGYFSKKGGRLDKAYARGGSVKLNQDTVDRGSMPFIPAFVSSFKLPTGAELEEVAVKAMVDQIFKKNAGAYPRLPPQSHWVNARTKADYHATNNGKQVNGNLLWSTKYCPDTQNRAFVPC